MRVVTMFLVASPSMALPPLHLPSSPRARAPSLSQLFTSEAGAFIRQDETDKNESLADADGQSLEDRYSDSPDTYSQERVDNIPSSLPPSSQETINVLQEYGHKKINESMKIQDIESPTLYTSLHDKTNFESKNEDIKSTDLGSEDNPVDVDPTSFVTLMREIMNTLMKALVKGLTMLFGAREEDSQQK